MPVQASRLVDLANGSTLTLDDARGSTLRVTRGELWLTQHHDPRDIVLARGDAWTIERQGATLATALADSRVALAGPVAARIDARGRKLAWYERVRDWLVRYANAQAERRGVPYV
jgi:hypothetical protein